MKIVYISVSSIPSDRANSIQVMKVCQALAQAGQQVNLLTPAVQAEDPGWEVLARHYGLSTSFDIQFLRLLPVWDRRGFAWQAVRRARNLNADLIYTRTLPPAVLGLLAHIPVILEMHQQPGGSFGPIWYRQFLVLPGKKRMVPITRALKSALEHRFQPMLPENQVVVAPSGVDLERYLNLPDPEIARSQLKLPSGWTIGCSGHLYKGRGMELVIELARRMPDVHFLWAGGNLQDVESWQQRLKQLDIKNITLTSFVPNRELPLYQAACEVLLIPYEKNFSNSGGENIADVSSPMKVFEYMAARRVIVSSDLPVLGEVLNPANAILCPPNDPDAWEKALRQLQLDPQTGQRLADQALLDVERYSWAARCRNILAGFMEGSQ
jgi:glycosyltransferase involved in cell wall biosynthesis